MGGVAVKKPVAFLLTLLWGLYASVTASGVSSEVACACERARMRVCRCVLQPQNRVILYAHGHTPAGPVHLCYACYSFWSEQRSRTRTVCAPLNACVRTRPQLRRWGAARRGSRPYGLIAHCSSLLCGDRGPSHGLWPRHSARDWLHAHRIRDRGNQRGYTCQIDESIEPSWR